MKKITFIIIVVLLLAEMVLPFTVRAEKQDEFFGGKSELSYVEDSAGLLSGGERSELERRAKELSEKFKCDVRILTVDDMEDYGFNAIEEFSYYLYTEFDFRYGSEKDCVLIVLSMAGRDYDLRVWGDYAETAFTLYGIDKLLDKHVLPSLKENNYSKAFSVFLDRAEVYFNMAEKGNPFTSRTDPAQIPYKAAFVLIVSLLSAFIVCTVWKRKMKTAVIARTADNYIPAGGFNLTGQEDTFLYRTTTRTKVVKSSSSSDGRARSGGPSGRSGKF